MAQQLRALGGLQLAGAQAMALAGALGEVLEQQQDVVAALTQRRDAQRRDVQPVVEVGAKAPLVGGQAQVFLGRGDHPDVQGDQLVAAQALDRPLLQQAQQLDLHLQAHALDLVEEQGAAVGELELADAAPRSAGEGAGLVAEQLALHHRFGQGAGVDRHEGPAAATGQVVQGARHHLLAGAGFTEDQHVGGDPGEGADLFAQALHARRLADQARAQLVAVAQGQAQAAVVQHQAAQGQGAAHAVEQVVAGEGLFQEVIGAGAHRLHGQGHVAVTGDQQHRQLRVLLMQLLEQLQAVDARHADIADHHPGPVALDACGGAPGIGQAGDLEPGQVEGLAQGLAQMGVIVDQQDLGAGVEGQGHGAKSSGG